MAFVSILNDVIGPIMRGPSSSHTAGAYRIGQLCRMLSDSPPAFARVSFDPSGSYAPTYAALGVDLAFGAALLGWQMTDERYDDVLSEVSRRSIDLVFDIEPLAHADHPNAVRVLYRGSSGESLEIWARSVGGGMVEIYRVDEAPCHIDGKAHSILVICDPTAAEAVTRALRAEDVSGDITCRDAGRHECAIQLDSLSKITAETVVRTRLIAGVKCARRCAPILFMRRGDQLFATAQEMLDLSARRDWSLGRSAMAYESQILGVSQDYLDKEMLSRAMVMKDSVDAGMDHCRVSMSLTDPVASSMLAAAQQDKLPLGGVTARAAARSLAALHICNSRGVVCAAPTGGSAGVIPGVLLTLREQYRLDDDAVISLLFAAGAVGLVMALRATFAAEEAGCQVEIGVAGAMAAAMVVQNAGGTAAQCAEAASVSLQNTMGLTCDPVGGGCEIPCHGRTANAAAAAFTTADLIMGGFKSYISLDDAIDASYTCGKALDAALRCTALGGIAVTPSARKLLESRMVLISN